METQKKLSLILFVFVIIMICLAGCSKSNKDIAKDIAAVDSYFSNYNLRLTDYDITKRQTNDKEKTDYIWITISGENDDFSYSASYIVTYVKYNDGWLLENYSLNYSNYSATSEPNVDDVKQSLSKKYSDINIVEDKGTANSNEKKYTLSGIIEDSYITRTYEIAVDYEFSPETGWCKTNENETITKNQYNIVGEWLFEDSEHSYYIHISESVDNNIKFKYIFLNKTINADDGYWQLRQSDYETYTINSLSNNEYYFDVSWKKTYNTVNFADKDYIWFCNNNVTVHGNVDNGLVANGHFLKRISECKTDDNCSTELTEASKKYVVDYKKIPAGIFDENILIYLNYLNKPYEELHSLIKQTGINQKYSLEKAKFINNQVYIYLWIVPEKGATPDAIDLEATGYSCDELRAYFQNDLKWNIYENSENSFVVIVPNTDLKMLIKRDLFSATISIKKV